MTAQHGSRSPWGRRRNQAFRVIPLSLVAAFLLALTGCGGDDEGKKEATSVAGTFVGKVSGTKAFVAVVASPAAKNEDRRDVTVYVCDARSLCESFRGSATGDDFVANADEGDAEANGNLSDKAATGTIELAGKTVRYNAGQATATAGLYDLTVSSRGKLRGASAAGVGLTGELPRAGTGRLKLADGKRLRFDVTRDSEGNRLRLRPGQVRLIVLPGGQLSGAGKNRRTAGGGTSDFFIRSSR
jgi:hypothetical protein